MDCMNTYYMAYVGRHFGHNGWRRVTYYIACSEDGFMLFYNAKAWFTSICLSATIAQPGLVASEFRSLAFVRLPTTGLSME